MKTNFKILNLFYIIPFLIGVIAPFVSAIIVIELFFVGIFLAFLLGISIIILIANIFVNQKENYFNRYSTMIAFIIPIFIFSQILSSFVVNKVQKFRSDLIIRKIQNKEIEIPSKPKKSFGIEYYKLKNNDFVVEYERGFFVTEKYYDSEKKWKSYGWND